MVIVTHESYDSVKTASTPRAERTIDNGTAQELHCGLETHLLQRWSVGLKTQPVERLETTFECHVVSHKRQMASIHCDVVQRKHRVDFLSKNITITAIITLHYTKEGSALSCIHCEGWWHFIKATNNGVCSTTVPTGTRLHCSGVARNLRFPGPL